MDLKNRKFFALDRKKMKDGDDKRREKQF